MASLVTGGIDMYLVFLGLKKKMFGSYYPTLPSFCPLP